MSETDGTTDAAVDSTVTQPTSFIDDSGNFKDGWRDKYVPEDVRGEAVFDRVKTIQGMAKSLASAERMIGADKMVKPSDKFGDSDWDSYYQAGGWKNEPIPIKPPEGLPEGLWREDAAQKYSEGFNKLRLNPKQVAGIMELYYSDLNSQITDMNNNRETSLANLKSELLTEKGNAYTQFIHNGNFAIEKGVRGEPAEFKARIIEKFGNDPDLIRLLGNLGSQFGESGSIKGTDMIPTPKDTEAKIQEIYNSDAFMKPTHPGHKDAMANLARLHKEKASTRQPV